MAVTLVYKFDVTIPAGTPKAAPLVTPTVFEPNTVEHVGWLFPDGCGGQVGIQVGAKAIPVIPRNSTQWFIRSGDSAGIDLEDMHTSGDWSIIGYNLGAFAHTIHVTFKVHRHKAPSERDMILVRVSDFAGMGEG